jgi:hypothetical protein
VVLQRIQNGSVESFPSRALMTLKRNDLMLRWEGVDMELEDKETWLRHRVVRLRTTLRFAKDPRTEAGLKEFIADAEERLDALEKSRRERAKAVVKP